MLVCPSSLSLLGNIGEEMGPFLDVGLESISVPSA